MVGVCHHDALEDNISECHVAIKVRDNLPSKDMKDAKEGLGDGDPMSKAGPEVSI
jgi:hypothetical protein